MVDPVSRPSDRRSVVLEVPDGLPQLTVDAARVLLAMLYPTAVEAPVVEIEIGGSSEEPEAIAS